MAIESTTNERIKAVRRLHRPRERHRTGRTLLEGPKLIAAALDGGVVPIAIFAVDRGPVVDRCEFAGSDVVDVSERVLRAMATTLEPQGPIGVIETPPPGELSDRSVVVPFEIADPGNLGTLIRTADALGWHAAVIGGADPWSPKVLRAAAGAHFTRSPACIETIPQIAALAFTTIATVVSGGEHPESIIPDGPVALIVGNEARGLPEAVVAACDAAMTIPMHGPTQSLNAAVAGAIGMYALGAPERAGAPSPPDPRAQRSDGTGDLRS